MGKLFNHGPPKEKSDVMLGFVPQPNIQLVNFEWELQDLWLVPRDDR